MSMMRVLVAAAALLALMCTAAGDAEIKVINPGARFPEGPVWREGKLYYVEYGGHTVMSWDGKTGAQLWKQDGCGPAAVVFTANGNLLVACYDANSVVRISASGKTLASYTKSEDAQPFIGPNDFATDSKGGVYFTTSGPWESARIVGKIFYMGPRGIISMVADDLHYANGIALSADGKTLYCAESEAFRVVRFAVAEDGSLSDRRLFARLNEILPESGAAMYPDGLKMDSRGRLYIGQFSAGQILVVSAEGRLERTLDVPSPSAPNLTFGPSEDVVYVMAVDDVNNAPWLGKVYEVPNE